MGVPMGPFYRSKLFCFQFLLPYIVYGYFLRISDDGSMPETRVVYFVHFTTPISISMERQINIYISKYLYLSSNICT